MQIDDRVLRVRCTMAELGYELTPQEVADGMARAEKKDKSLRALLLELIGEEGIADLCRRYALYE